ncbi:hypothetical protein CTAYLR_003212 [Chrysophaeum taylorii]|uniref:L-dopachrome isomerase n=1 Tax=Chrysophaeum taylorii TaxID=2483200 RepID=A0AAD7UC60_9STRA|nr:hypothetical protein CTAYLR_003212 [Chrysophaeum taylorii]
MLLLVIASTAAFDRSAQLVGTPYGRAGASRRVRDAPSMPSLIVQSAVAPASPRKLCTRLSKAVALALGKPESYVLTSFQKVDAMSFGGDADTPAAFLYLSSLGSITPETNKDASKAIADILQDELGVPPNRYYINFLDSPRPNMGYNGGTF